MTPFTFAPMTGVPTDDVVSSVVGARIRLGDTSLDVAASMDAAELAFRLGIDTEAADRLAAAFELSRRRMESPLAPRASAVTPSALFAHLGAQLADLPHEVFMAVVVDARHRLVAVTTVSQGVRTASLVHPREFFRPVLIHNGAAVIAVHNHPSGVPEPSDDDDVVTDRLARAGDLLGLPLIDHLVIAGRRFYSYREHMRSDVLHVPAIGGASLARSPEASYDVGMAPTRFRSRPFTPPDAWCFYTGRGGRGALVLAGDALVKVVLPSAPDALGRALADVAVPRRPVVPSATWKPVIDALETYLRGDAGVDPADVDVLFAVSGLTPFVEKVYDELRAVPRGSTVTYGELARRAGRPGAARAVGGAMARNPFPLFVPCHRVLASGGAIGGFSADGGLDYKRKLLALEGVELPGSHRVEGGRPGC